MLDYRLKTFLTLCEMKNYTKTAEKLFITQPAVTKQIQYLEEHYGIRLFEYRGKQLQITEAGQELYAFALTLSRDVDRKIAELAKLKVRDTYRFGATLTIGGYWIPPVLSRFLRENSELSVSMTVDNTELLLEYLKSGRIDFALIEGNFDKTQYSWEPFLTEEFIGICSSKSSLAIGQHSLEELTGERLILREKGSGTRNVFEQILYEQNLRTSSFSNVCEIGSMSVLLKLVEDGCGISFLYHRAAAKGLKEGKLAQMIIKELPVTREMHGVWLKDSRFTEEYHKFIKRCHEEFKDMEVEKVEYEGKSF